jgi:CheY-like chemotaxis protein
VRAVGLTRQLLAYSRRPRANLSPLDLNAVVSDLSGLLQRLLPEDIELALDLHPELGRAKVQAGQAEQILMNLVLNARDAMPHGGWLTLQTANVLLDEPLPGQAWPVPAGPYVMLAVKDTGVGMDEPTRARLFEPFFTTKRPGEGTGLGLATVWDAVRACGGAIEVVSAPGEGTTFRVYLPQAEQPDAGWNGARGAAPAGRTVLVVEDADGVRSLIRDLLVRCAHTVLQARSASEALEIGAQHPGPIDLLVVNAVMPQMPGPALAEWLAARHPGLKVLYLSGQGVGPMPPAGLLSLDTPLLEKPFTPTAFMNKVRELLAGRAVARSTVG